MGFIPARCTQCGAEIKVDSSQETGMCEYCGTPFITEKVIHNTYVTNNFHGATVNIINGEAKNFLKLAETYLNSNVGKEAYDYASKALELQPNLTKAWIIKMHAISLCGKISDLNTKEIISCGRNAIDSGTNAVDVLLTYLSIASEWLNIACQKISDLTQLKLMESNGSTDLQMFASNDNEFRKLIYRYADGALELKLQIPAEIITKNESIQQVISTLANQYLDYCQMDKKRCLLYGRCLTDDELKLRKECLHQLQIGLPIKLQIKEIIFDDNRTQTQNGKCYIATTVYGSYDHPSVCLLRRFRDHKLSTNIFGKIFVVVYYNIGSYLIKYLGENKFFLLISKKILDHLVLKIKDYYGYSDAPYHY